MVQKPSKSGFLEAPFFSIDFANKWILFFLKSICSQNQWKTIFFSTWIAQGWIVTSSSAVNQVLRQTWVLNSNASDVFINLFYQYRKAIVESAAQEAADAIGNRREIWVTYGEILTYCTPYQHLLTDLQKETKSQSVTATQIAENPKRTDRICITSCDMSTNRMDIYHALSYCFVTMPQAERRINPRRISTDQG